MKKKEKASIVGLSISELDKQIRELRMSLAASRVDRYTKHSKNTRARGLERSRLAVLSTIKRQKELAHE